MTDTSPSRPPTRSLTRTFSVAVPIDRAWEVMTDPAEMTNWFFAPVGDGAVPEGFDLYGGKAEIDVLDADPPRMLRYGEQGGPVPKVDGYGEVTVTFEDEGSGTRITITRSGFGEGDEWDAAFEAVGHGLDETIADFILYVEHGVAYPRHPRGARSSVGVLGVGTRTGLEVRVVLPASFAARAGMGVGDVLIELGGAALFSHHDLMFFQRSHPAGDVVEAAWVRDGQLCRGSAALDTWRPAEWPMPDSHRISAPT